MTMMVRDLEIWSCNESPADRAQLVHKRGGEEGCSKTRQEGLVDGSRFVSWLPKAGAGSMGGSCRQANSSVWGSLLPAKFT